MEENRLKPMIEGYDVNVFNDIYYKTEKLRRKLASEIDARRFRVDQEEIFSWFSVKFIHTFNKYYGIHDNERLKGDIISALQRFKCRILRSAYTIKNSQDIISSELVNLESQFIDDEPKIDYYQELINFIKSQIPDNAVSLLEIQLNPPPYILRKLREKNIENIYKIPDEFILEYFDMRVTNRSLKYLEYLRKEIKFATAKAKEHFKNN